MPSLNGLSTYYTAFVTLKKAIIQTPISCYPDPARRYIVYMGASDNACGTQLSWEHNRTKFPVAFLSYTFTETQMKWSTPEQKSYGIYYAVIHKYHKPLVKFLNGKNTNNKVNRWRLELATYNITFK